MCLNPVSAPKAVNDAIRAARRQAQAKQVWLVYCIDDDESTVKTVWSQADAFGEIKAWAEHINSISNKAAMDAALLRIANLQVPTKDGGTRPATPKEKRVETDRMERGQGDHGPYGTQTKKERNARPFLVAQLVKMVATGQMPDAIPEGELVKYTSLSKAIPESERTPFEDDLALHAEEKFIRAWSTIKGAYAGPDPIERVSLYLSFSPCSAGSSEKELGGETYERGCLNKLKRLAGNEASIQWDVHYDEYFKTNREDCLAAANSTPNLRMFKLRSM